jgi:hypothetical protein
MQWLVRLFALVFIGLYAAVWIWIGLKLRDFTPTPTKSTLDLPNDWVSFAGFLSSTVAAGTAAVLGIEIKGQGGSGHIATRAFKAALASALLLVGILVYVGVGLFVVYEWLRHTEEAPDLIRAFSFGVAGWLAGCYVAIFHKTNGNM